MKARHPKFFAVLLAAVALVGCDQGKKAPAKTRVHVVNVAPDFSALGFQREQPPGQTPETLAFKGPTHYDYDADTYDFFVYQRTLTSQASHQWQFTKELVGDKNYAFVLAEAAGQISTQIVEYAPKAVGSTDTQVAALNAGEALPPMDVYIEKAGVGIAGATPKASLAFLAQMPPVSLATGDYEITITAVGAPGNVLFTSPVINLAAAATNVFVIAAEGGLGTEQISVVMLQDNPAVLYSTNATSGLRVINGASDAQPHDVAVNHEFSPPLFPAVPYGTATSYVTTPINTSLPLNVTPAGNSGVLEIDSTVATAPGQLSTLVFAGNAGALGYQIVADDRRRIFDEAKVRFINASTQFTTATELVLMPPNTADQTTVAATAIVPALGMSDYLYIVPATYDLLLRETSTNTVRAGPIPVNLAARGIYGILVLNGPDTATASIVFLDDQP